SKQYQLSNAAGRLWPHPGDNQMHVIRSAAVTVFVAFVGVAKADERSTSRSDVRENAPAVVMPVPGHSNVGRGSSTLGAQFGHATAAYPRQGQQLPQSNRDPRLPQWIPQATAAVPK